ncbi:hypothetical protein EDC65_3975 [Stella humosa]|uniref:Uncharacterized protein n=1 Tax=Stella humosa TaxID=94 RepID=A0A3N1L0W4_9PROT|nr:hypothetical protein [Stella humosa]ROP84620.1 hypothetical protein EDC65_3975 [Stella humosa]BBK34140.1 hypothetical protein STHU_47740 [Stella humosa]
MSLSERAGLLLVAAGLMAGCQPLPRPLADLAVPGPELLNLPGRGGLAVLEVEGLTGQRASGFAQALAEALQSREVPAIAGAGMRESVFLIGRVSTRDIGGDGLEIDWEWELVDDKGTTIDRREERDVMMRRDWEWAGAKALAARAAPAVAALYEGQMPQPQPPEAKPLIFLAGITGAPGDGGRTLPRALATVIEGRQMTPTTDRAAATAIVTGSMSVKPAARGKEQVEISWRVTRANGEEVGVVSQANEIPAGSLKGPWGEVAGFVALAAADGIVDLVRRIPATKPASR